MAGITSETNLFDQTDEDEREVPAAIQALRDDLDIAIQDYQRGFISLRDGIRKVSSVLGVDINIADIEHNIDYDRVYLSTDDLVEIFANEVEEPGAIRK